jgi:hypothetical protein
MQPATNKALTSSNWYWLAALSICFYGYTVIQLADNTPKFDDLSDVFGFFKAYFSAITPWQKWVAFSFPNNEHITLVDHLIYYLQYQLLGQIRFFPLILSGHLIIILTGILLGCSTNSPLRPFYFFAITLAYINLQYWDSSFKAMTAISNQIVILFAVATVLVLLNEKKSHTQKLSLAILLATLATFSQGNGMLVWPTGLLLLLTHHAWQSQRWRSSAIWAGFTLLSVCGYFLAVHYWHEHVSIAEKTALKAPIISATPALLWQQFYQNPLLPLQATMAFLGGTLFGESQTLGAILVGGVGCLLFLRQMKQRLCLNATHYIALFLFLSAITVGFTRGLAYAAIEPLVNSHYKMYSIAFIMLALISFAESHANNRVRLSVLIVTLSCALVINVSSYSLAESVRIQSQKFQQSYDNWIVDGDFRRQAIYFPPMSDHFLFVANHLHLLDFTQLTDNKPWLPLSATPNTACNSTSIHENNNDSADCKLTATHRGNAIALQIQAQLNTDLQQPAKIIFCPTDNSTHTLETSPLPDTKPGAHEWLISQEQLPPGDYQVILQSANKISCESFIKKKTRRVEWEMEQIFYNN